MKRDELWSSQHGHTAGYVARIEMSLIDNMAAAIHGIKEKYPEPPQTQIKMHPDDFRAARREQYMYVGNPPTPHSLYGLTIILDDDAPRLPRITRPAQPPAPHMPAR